VKITRKQLRKLIVETLAETKIRPSLPGGEGAEYEDKIRRRFVNAPYGSKADLTQGSELASALDYEGPDFTRDVINYDRGALDIRVHMPDFQRLVGNALDNALGQIMLDRLRISLSSYKTIGNTQQLLNDKSAYNPKEKTDDEINDAMLDAFADELLIRNGYMTQVMDEIDKESRKGIHRFTSEIPPEFRTGALAGSQTTSSDPQEMEDFVRNVLAVDDSVTGLKKIIKDIFKQKFGERYINAIKYAEQLRANDFQGRLME
jgi:hypothetical protein